MSNASTIVENTLLEVRAIVDEVVPTVLSGSINVDTSDAEAVGIPAVSFDTIDISVAGQYLLAVLNGILALPNHRSVEFEDPGALGITLDTPTLDESLYASLKGNILGDVTTGGYGIDNLIERDLFERERDNVMGALETAKNAAVTASFSNGLSMPTGAMLGQMLDADLDATRKLEEANQKVIADRFAKYADAKKDAYTNGAELVKRVIDEYGIKIKTAIAAYTAKVDAYLKKTEAGVKVAGAELDAYLSSVEAYASQMKALEGMYVAMGSLLEYGYRTHDERLAAAIESAKAQVSILLAKSKADLEEESARLMAYAAVATAALSAINVHASVSESSSYSASNSVSKSASYSQSLGVSNNVKWTAHYDEAETMPTPLGAPTPIAPPDLARPGE